MTFQYLAACFLAAFISVTVAGDNSVDDVLTRSNGIFSTNLYSAITEGTDESVLISPLSLNYALTLASFGAEGDSLKELRTTLNHPDNEGAIISSYRKLSDNLKYGRRLTVATKMFVDNKFQLKEVFKNDMKSFNSGVDNVNFAGQPEESRLTINKFVDNKTNHLITELFGPGAVSKDTLSVIVNAVYFKSTWKHPFHRTNKETFYGLDKEYEVDMMYHDKDLFEYYDDPELKAELLELPYTAGFSFLIALPKNKKGITELENKIKAKASNANSSPFIDIFNNTRKREVEVKLPKFRFEQTHNLRQSLEKMGLKNIFGSNANFKKLSDSPVVVSDVIQKTYIAVSEKNTEAAAASGVNIQPLSAFYEIPDPIKFTADHPFIYVIKQKTTETPVFVGRYNKP